MPQRSVVYYKVCECADVKGCVSPVCFAVFLLFHSSVPFYARTCLSWLLPPTKSSPDLLQPHSLRSPVKGKGIWSLFPPVCLFSKSVWDVLKLGRRRDGHLTHLLSGIVICHMCRSIFFTFSQNSEINLSVIGPYIDYLKEKQGVNNVFGKFTCGFFLFIFVFFFCIPTWINSNIAWFIRWFVYILLFYRGRYVAPLIITFPGVKII